MKRTQLDGMRLEALRTLATERGIAEAPTLGRAELIERLVDGARETPSGAAPAFGPRPSMTGAAAPDSGRSAKRAGDATTTLPTAAATASSQPSREADVAPTPLPAAHSAGDRLDYPSSTVRPLSAAPPSQSEPSHPTEPFGMLDFEELPETYGVDECELLVRDPQNAFTYWEVTEAGLAGARAQLGQSAADARLVLRLFITTLGAHGSSRQLYDLDASWNHGRRYLHVPHPGAQLRVAVGLLSREGYFAPVAHSSLAHLPAAGPSEQIGTEWMEVVPAQGRGQRREPLVIVRRDGAHVERGAPKSLEPAMPEEGFGSSKPGAPGRVPGMGSGRC
jgi:hypothetical protein